MSRVPKTNNSNHNNTMRSVPKTLKPNVEIALRFSEMEQDEDFCIEVVKLYPEYLKYVKEQTEAICLAAVKNGRVLKYVNDQTDTICKAVIDDDPNEFINIRNLSEELAKYTLDKNLSCLGFMNQTEELCWYALKIDSSAIQYITEPTEEMKTYCRQNISGLQDLCTLLLGKLERNILNNLADLTPKNINAEIRKIVAEFLGIDNEDLDDNELFKKLMTSDQMLAFSSLTLSEDGHIKSVSVDPSALLLIEDQTDEIKWAALKANVCSICYIKDPTFEMVKYALDERIELFRCIENQTLEMCEYAVQKNCGAIQCAEYQTEQMCWSVVKERPLLINCCQHKPFELCKLAVELDPTAIQYVEQTEELVNIALKINPVVAVYLENPSIEQLLAAIKINPEAILKVGMYGKMCYCDVIHNSVPIEVVREAISMRPSLLRHATRHPDILNEFLERDYQNYQYVEHTIKSLATVLSYHPNNKQEILAMVECPILRRLFH